MCDSDGLSGNKGLRLIYLQHKNWRLKFKQAYYSYSENQAIFETLFGVGGAGCGKGFRNR